MKEYLVVIEKSGKNYSAYAPDVQGCGATGKTPVEARENLREAIIFHLEGLAEDGLPLPEPNSTIDRIAV
ncbi:MAG: type II toxin-antitoxin system HicB family antitoxin [Candidatus Riflebacteria bacterium]|nr:type II toxin-antitoxin system HicB family antitoxin [Candidatus Riflebacteria bacterium]